MIGESKRPEEDVVPGQAPLEGGQDLEVPQAAGRTATEASEKREVDYEAEYKNLRERKQQWASVIGEEFGITYRKGNTGMPNWGKFNGAVFSATDKMARERDTGEKQELTESEKIALAANDKNIEIINNFKALKGSFLKQQEKAGVTKPVLPETWEREGLPSGDVAVDPVWLEAEDELEEHADEARGMSRARIKKEFGKGHGDDSGLDGFLRLLSSAEERQRHNTEHPNDKWNLTKAEEEALDIRREEKSRDAEYREAVERMAIKRRAAKGDPIERLEKI